MFFCNAIKEEKEVTVPVRGVRCIPVGEPVSFDTTGYCPREGSEMHLCFGEEETQL